MCPSGESGHENTGVYIRLFDGVSQGGQQLCDDFCYQSSIRRKHPTVVGYVGQCVLEYVLAILICVRELCSYCFECRPLIRESIVNSRCCALFPRRGPSRQIVCGDVFINAGLVSKIHAAVRERPLFATLCSPQVGPELDASTEHHAGQGYRDRSNWPVRSLCHAWWSPRLSSLSIFGAGVAVENLFWRSCSIVCGALLLGSGTFLRAEEATLDTPVRTSTLAKLEGGLWVEVDRNRPVGYRQFRLDSEENLITFYGETNDGYPLVGDIYQNSDGLILRELRNGFWSRYSVDLVDRGFSLRDVQGETQVIVDYVFVDSRTFRVRYYELRLGTPVLVRETMLSRMALEVMKALDWPDADHDAEARLNSVNEHLARSNEPFLHRLRLAVEDGVIVAVRTGIERGGAERISNAIADDE